MKYDRIHDNQVEWYKNQINALTEENGGETPKSLAFFHIPLIEYKGIRLTYGYSIDYLAYIGIMKHGIQRGCTMINIAPDGSFDTKLENYYQDKYSSVKDKERVDMESWIPIY